MFQTLTLPSPPLHLRFPRRLSVRCSATVQDRPSAATSRSSSLYEVLRVNRAASATEIKAAYRSLAKLYHPDAAADGSDDGRDFMEIHRAYETLSDPSTRAVYDVSIGMSSRAIRLTAASLEADFLAGRRRTGFYPTRRWETDQCW